MGRLTDREFWEKRYEGKPDDEVPEVRSGLRGVLDRARLRAGARPGDAYYMHLMTECYRNHLPANPDWKVIEIGCAPGRSLIRFARLFGYQPYGVEYTPNGAALTREYFEACGESPDNVIEADFFSEAFLQQWEGQFDVVFSGGFIEHFDDPATAVANHARLLKEGGYLVCSIPNLNSWSWPLFRLFSPDILDVHNLSIMRLGPYRSLFEGLGLTEAHCDYVGTFDLVAVASMAHSDSGLARFVARIADKFADIMNHLLFMILRGRALESRMSPMIIYIGRKTGDASQTGSTTGA